MIPVSDNREAASTKREEDYVLTQARADLHAAYRRAREARDEDIAACRRQQQAAWDRWEQACEEAERHYQGEMQAALGKFLLATEGLTDSHTA